MNYLWILFTLISAILFAVKDVLSKKLLKNNIEPLQIVFEQYFLMFIVLTFIFFNKIDFISIYNYWYLYFLKASTIFMFTSLYLFLMEKFEISKFTPLMNISPIFLIILSSIFLNENLNLFQYIGIIIIIISTYILEVNINFHHLTNPHSHHLNWVKRLDYKNVGLIFTMLFIISITAITDKIIFNKGISVYSNMFYTSLLIFIFLSFYYLKNKKFFLVFSYIKKEPLTFIISIFSLISTFFILLAISMPTAMVSLVVPLKRTSTLFSAIIGGLLFHEKHLFKKIIAIIFMIIGIVFLTI